MAVKETIGNKMKKKKKKRWSSASFYDLNLAIDGLSPTLKSSLVTTALQLGYSGIALNHVIKGAMSSSSDLCSISSVNLSAIASDNGSDIVRSAHFHREVLHGVVGTENASGSLGTDKRRGFFRQYRRLTLVVDNAMQAASLNPANPLLKSYDIVAIRPLEQRVFEQACGHLEVDIISLDFKSPIRLRAPSVKAAIERGVFFEIVISGAFQDIKARRQLFANAQILQGLTRGRNIIITSGAQRWMDLRGPNDIANLGTMFSLSREYAKASVSKNCESVIMHGLERKKFKSAFIIDRAPSSGQESGEGDAMWFDVPKVWDPLSNTKMEEVYVLPEIQNECNGSNNNNNDDRMKLLDAFTSQSLDTEFPHENEEEEESGFLGIDPSFDTGLDHQKKRKKLNIEKPPKQKHKQIKKKESMKE